MSHSVRVSANFPELPAAHAEITATGTGSTKKSAISDAVRSVLSSPKLKGKRYTSFKINFFILGSDNTSDESDESLESTD